MSVPALEAQHLSQLLGGRAVLDKVSFSASSSERIALIGPNGAGKSTLLRRLAGLIDGPGEVLVAGREVGTLDPRARGRAIAYLPQERRIAWGVRVETLVALGRMPHGHADGFASLPDRTAIDHAMARLDIAAWRNRPATALSQGEQARVLLARALATQASVLLADEPVAALDPRHQLAVLDALAGDAKDGALVIVILHDLTLAAQWASRVILLDGGRIVADGTPADIMNAKILEPVFNVGISLGGTPAHPLIGIHRQEARAPE